MTLLDAGFSDEAFGMTRTLIDIFITLRYIANKDTDERAQLYYEFVSKDVQTWHFDAKDYWPSTMQSLSARTIKIAARYRSPHRWSGKSVKDMALEPDTVEVNPATGQPAVHDFAYRVMYRWTSHYVHPTIVALFNHVVKAGRDNFVVRSGSGDMMGQVVLHAASYVRVTMSSFYRCMGDPEPQRVDKWGDALIKHLVRRH